MSESYVEPREDDEGEWQDRGFSVHDLIVAVRRRWWAVLVVFLLVFGWSMWRTLRQERLYTAATTVRIQDNQMQLAGVMPQSATVDWRVDRLLSEQQVIKSQQVAERVTDELGLRIIPDPASKIRQSEVFDSVPPRLVAAPTVTRWMVRFGPSSYSVEAGGQNYGTVAYGDSITAAGLLLRYPHHPPTDRDRVALVVRPKSDAVAQVRGGIATRVVPQTDIVEIGYTGNDPLLVKQVTDAIARNYAQYSAEQARRNASGRSSFIQGQLKEQYDRLRQAQDSLKNFQELNQTSDVSKEQLGLAENIAKLEQEKQEVLVERNIYQQLIGKLAAADTADEELRRIIGTGAAEKNAAIANQFSEWFDLQKERAKLLAGGKNENYQDVRAVDTLIVQTKRDIQRSSGVYLQALGSRLQSIEQTQADLRAQAQKYPPLTAQQARLVANVLTSQQLYNELQSEFQRAQIAAAADVGEVSIIDAAVLPTFAVSPNRKRAATTAILFGLLLGLAAAVGLDRLDNSVRSPDEIRERFDVTVLGMIPKIRLSDIGMTEKESTAMTRLVTHADPRSPVAEAYRSLRTNIAFARAKQELRTLVLTSPGPADGKSTTIANLAITFAQQGQRTLVVDADLRRAVLDKSFGVPRAPGLTDVLLGSMALAAAVHETNIPNLFVLGSGQFPPNPSELLGSESMRELIAAAREQFDVVLFDTPPLLAVTDAAVLSTRVDGTMLVVRMGSTAREAVRRALLSLRAVRIRVLGAVLNDVDFRNGSYYGGYGYYYTYYYYGEPGEKNGNGNGKRNGVIGRMGDRLRGLARPGGRRA